MPSLSEFDYELPPESIAQTPAAERDLARLLVLDRASGSIEHSTVRKIGRFLRSGDLLVFNDTKVRPARVFGRGPNGGEIELLLLNESESGVWDCLGRPAKRLRVGADVNFPGGSRATVLASDGGSVRVRFDHRSAVARLMAEHGEIPLPPYIKRPDGPLPLDADRYQTVLARHDGAVAAPTAGLHFTTRLLDELRSAGVRTTCLTLHVGPGTFLPVRGDDVSKHVMTGEQAEITAETVDAITETRRRGGRVIAVGTTTTRALESAASKGELHPGQLLADTFITPGFQFRVIDALLTNFHLPRSTLLMLVCALAGRERILRAYSTAVAEGYRFYSYGDAMLIL